jgi:hypothetical protein
MAQRRQLDASRITWTPDHCAEGPEDLLWTVKQTWTYKEEPQLWVLGFVADPRLPDGAEEVALEVRDLRGRRHEVRLPKRRIRKRGVRGDHLLFARAHWEPDGDRLVYDRAVLVPILDRSCPVPVDSSYERRALRVIQRRGLAFCRPLFSIGNVFPDVLLPEHRIVIEVQGVRSHDYRERKSPEQIIARYARSPEYADWQLILWGPNQAGDTAGGDGFAAFLRQLPAGGATPPMPAWQDGLRALDALAPPPRERLPMM